MPLVNLWLDRNAWPPGFDARVLALAVALKFRVDGVPLSVAPDEIGFDLGRVWRTVSVLSQDALGEVLALALLRADSTIFDFDSVAPSWPADVGQVIAERRSLRDFREPAPVWLKAGYALLGDTFSEVRSMGSTFEDCQEVWDAYATDREMPSVFEMAFWWEATYCLTERHAYHAAEKAQERVAVLANNLETLTGLVDPMWHHQQGRLYYYAGNHELALAEYLREYKTHGEDLKVAAMLNREIANVLSDLACLDAAKHFAEKSVAVARSQGQRTELYKSLGRLAEISIKQGNHTDADLLLNESLSIQEKMGDDNRAPSQTLTYLGHVAILTGNLEQAADWYNKAIRRDGDNSSQPYITMGRFALAEATGNAVELENLWNTFRERIDLWAIHKAQVLPAAVCMLAAAHHIAQARVRLPTVVHALVESRYAIEASYALQELSESTQSSMTGDILVTLKRWQKTLASIPPALREAAGPLNGPTALFEAIQKATLHDNASLRECCYPMTLIATFGCRSPA